MGTKITVKHKGEIVEEFLQKHNNVTGYSIINGNVHIHRKDKEKEVKINFIDKLKGFFSDVSKFF